MSEELKEFQTTPTLTLNHLGRKKCSPALQRRAADDESVLSEEERKMSKSFCKSVET